MFRVIIFGLLQLILYCQSNAQPSICKASVYKEKAHFYNQIITNGNINYVKKNSYLIQNDVVEYKCEEINKDYVLVNFKNNRGVITSGYIKTSDLVKSLDQTNKNTLDGEYEIRLKNGNGGSIMISSINDSIVKFFIALSYPDVNDPHTGSSWGYAVKKNNTAKSIVHEEIEECKLQFTLVNDFLNVIEIGGDCSYSAKAFIENKYKRVRSNITLKELENAILELHYYIR